MRLDVLSAAVGEITRDLAPGSVGMRLRGREFEFVVTQPNTEPDGDGQPAETVDLTVGAGTVTVLLGPNGAGKTTTMHILSTLVRPTGATPSVIFLGPS